MNEHRSQGHELFEVSGADWQAVDLVLDHAVAIANRFEARSHHGAWAVSDGRHLFLSLRPEVDVGDPYPPDVDVVLGGRLTEPIRLELHQLQESLDWDFRLVDGDQVVYQWGPGDHGRALFPSELATHVTEQLDSEGWWWGALAADQWRAIDSGWNEAASLTGAHREGSKPSSGDPGQGSEAASLGAEFVDALIARWRGVAPPHGDRVEPPRAQLVAAHYRPVADTVLRYAPLRPPSEFWRRIVERRARPGTTFSVSCYAGDPSEHSLAAALGEPDETVYGGSPLPTLLRWDRSLDERTQTLLSSDPWRPDGLMHWAELYLDGAAAAHHGCELTLDLRSDEDHALVRDECPPGHHVEVRSTPPDGVVYDARRDGPSARGLVDWRQLVEDVKRAAG